jgi:hypothetical protein
MSSSAHTDGKLQYVKKKRVSVPLQTPSVQDWNIITLGSHVICVYIWCVLFAFSMEQIHKSVSFFQFKISTKTKQKEKKKSPHFLSSIGIIIHQKNYSNKWLRIRVGVRLTWLTTLGGCLGFWDLEKSAPPAQWTSTHQHTIHWMPVITQLWMNFNWVNIWFHLGNQFCKK